MNYTAVTAIIITFHHLSAILSLILAFLFTMLAYWVFIRHYRYRSLAFVITVVAMLIIGSEVSERVFQQQPFGIEIVKAG